MCSQSSSIEQKPCTQCQRSKPATTKYFWRNAGTYDGLLPKCKECATAARKKPGVCKICGAAYVGQGNTCSKDCANVASRRQVFCVCQQCGVSFSTQRSHVAKGGGKFCSNKCARAGMFRRNGASQLKTREWRQCEYCGADFEARQSRLKKGMDRFCSQRCGTDARVERNRRERWIYKQCDYCVQEFGIPLKDQQRRQNARYCSHDCRIAAQRPDSVEFTCSNCEAVFELPRHAANARNKAERPYCSWQCFRQSTRLWEWRDCECCGATFRAPGRAVKKGQGRFCSNGCKFASAYRISAGETQLGDALAHCGFSVHRQVQFKLYTIDLVIGAVAIEYDGDYWHSLPGAAERDARKDAALEAAGYTVVRVPEQLWQDAPNAAVESVVAAVSGDSAKPLQGRLF